MKRARRTVLGMGLVILLLMSLAETGLAFPSEGQMNDGAAAFPVIESHGVDSSLLGMRYDHPTQVCFRNNQLSPNLV